MLTVKTILTIISTVLGLVQLLLGQAKSRDDNEAGQLQVAATILAKARKDLDETRNIESAVKSDSDSLSKPDEFTRAD